MAEKDATALSILIHRLFELKKYTMIAKYTTEVQRQFTKRRNEPNTKDACTSKCKAILFFTVLIP